MAGTPIIVLFKIEGVKLKALIISILIFCVVACTSSQDFSESSEAKNIMDKCYVFSKPTFVFESRCADIEGGDNSTICLGIQVADEGGFPKNMAAYFSSKEAINTQLFERLAFEDQRRILFLVDEGTRIRLTKLVHHGWGTMGQYWIVRGMLIHENRQYEVELPSLDLIHKKPLWFDARANMMPSADSIQNLKKCS